MIPFSTTENVRQPETFTIGVYTKYEGTWWFPYYIPTASVVYQQVLPELMYAVDPPADLPATPIQLYKKSACVEFLIRGKCSWCDCPREHITQQTLWHDLGLYKRRENTVGSIPDSVDELERRPPCATTARMEEWVTRQNYFGVVIFSKNHPVYWIRNFKSIDIGRMEFWSDLEYVFTPNKLVAIIQKPLVADLRQVQAIKLFSKPLCLFYFQYQKCERTNCTFLHRSEREIALLIAKRYYEIKALSKNERFDHIVHIDGLGQTSQFSNAEKIRYQLEEREMKRAEKTAKEADGGARDSLPKHSEASKEEKPSDASSRPVPEGNRQREESDRYTPRRDKRSASYNDDDDERRHGKARYSNERDDDRGRRRDYSKERDDDRGRRRGYSTERRDDRHSRHREPHHHDDHRRRRERSEERPSSDHRRGRRDEYDRTCREPKSHDERDRQRRHERR
ncbi:3-methyladenine DNA glycosylase / 8-oxoguanine DNA glycosylase [Perkinsela sp. CCAP 1560/4]|nr:3-methyladenine DNA glycosylase / 8-oxoguanine DNA glycosylase [Perkinsela sp. CCAP 1560/4]|eukprot:KNH04278.1 3-methyladenine DNA glycosylase / 8-oxoguanine DNA glycosylase [Perkinsela sp. CCAP 1560/4]